VLFAARVSPFAKVRELDDDTARRVLSVGRKLLLANVADVKAPHLMRAGAAARRTTGLLNPSQRAWVYGRTGKPCRRCGTAIASAKQGEDARGTYWCPRCQPRPEPPADSAGRR